MTPCLSIICENRIQRNRVISSLNALGIPFQDTVGDDELVVSVIEEFDEVKCITMYYPCEGDNILDLKKLKKLK